MIAAHGLRRGVTPIGFALFVVGGYVMLSALIFLFPFVASPYAQQNDVYMGNLFLGAPIFLLGSLLFVISLASLGLRARLAALLALINLLPVVMFWLGGNLLPILIYIYIAGAYAFVLLLLSWSVARRNNQLSPWRRGLMLALLATGILALFYILFGGHYVSVGDASFYWPPYLTLTIAIIAGVLALVIFVTGWIWATVWPRQETPSVPSAQV
jgi:hypothetical protein